MPTPNPFFALQERLAALVAAASYFAGLSPAQILTEKIAGLEFQVENSLLPLGFGVVITTASGKAMEGAGDYEALVTLEDLNVSIVHNPQTDPAHSALDALAAALAAIHGQSVQPTAPPAQRPHDFFRVTGHQRRVDAPANCTVHEIYVTAGLRLL
jgi:hypothetical protein